MDRRQFTRSLVLAPLALSSSGDAQQTLALDPHEQQPPLEPKRPLKTAAEYNRHPPVNEQPPFYGPLKFVRQNLRARLQPFELREVQLLKGPLQEARVWNRAYMLRLPNDRLLHNFRVNAGLASQATPLGGWEAPTSELRGHFVGHYLSAAATLYAAIGDSEVKKKADDLVSGIAECQAKLNNNGYVSAFPDELFARLDKRQKVWAPFYTLHKIMAGLLDMYCHVGNKQALDILLKLASWVDGWTASRSEEHMQDILTTEYGGMGDVLYRLATVAHDDRWAVAGDRFVKKMFFTPLALRQDILKGLHANTHMPQVISAAQRYEISSDARFAEVSEFFWETVAESRSYATGGSANTESWLTNSNHVAAEMKVSSHHQECCCAYNMMKLARHLYSWSGDPRYIDYYERNMWNHRLGTIQPKTGLTTYFLSMSPGAWKTLCTEDQTFWCCTGSGLEEFAKLNDTIYYHDDNDVYVNLFVQSELRWKQKNIRLSQQTSFPESDRTTLIVQTTPAGEWTIHLRIPKWTTAESSVSINGRKLEVAGTPGSYYAIRRAWKAGDKVELVVPMRLRAEPLHDDPTQQAFLYGPLVLAGQFPIGEIDFNLQHNQGPEIQELGPFAAPILAVKGQQPDRFIKRIPGEPLSFQTTGRSGEIVLKPINQSWKRFAVYFTVL